MSDSDELEHIQPGYAYHDGEAYQLYDSDDPESADEALFQQCVDYHIGPLWIHACLKLPGPTITVEVRLFGHLIGRCELSRQNPTCKIGGSIDGVKFEVSIGLQSDPLAIVLDGTICISNRCKSFHMVIPFRR